MDWVIWSVPAPVPTPIVVADVTGRKLMPPEPETRLIEPALPLRMGELVSSDRLPVLTVIVAPLDCVTLPPTAVFKTEAVSRARVDGDGRSRVENDVGAGIVVDTDVGPHVEGDRATERDRTALAAEIADSKITRSGEVGDRGRADIQGAGPRADPHRRAADDERIDEGACAGRHGDRSRGAIERQRVRSETHIPGGHVDGRAAGLRDADAATQNEACPPGMLTVTAAVGSKTMLLPAPLVVPTLV